MDVNYALKFLKDLSANNNRNWFQENKDRYEAARKEFCELLEELIKGISLFDPSVSHLEPRDCIFRIYRDVRFSHDKSPYKTHFGGFISAKGKKSLHCGYYIHLEPGNCLYAAGTYGLSTKILQAIRWSIYNGIDEYLDIIQNKKFKRLFPTVGNEKMKTAPKGFPKDFQHMDLLKEKEFCLYHNLSDSFFSGQDVVPQLLEICETSKPFLDFLNETIDDYID